MDIVADAPLMWGRKAYSFPGEHLGTGNRCGHDPDKPNWDLFTLKETKDALPKVMEKLILGVFDYYHKPDLLPTLKNLNGKTNQDGQPRVARSEAREADVLVMAAILSRTEFSTLRVGTPQDNGSFISRSCKELADIAGLANKEGEPTQRFWRAFRRLKLSGAFNVHLQYEVKEDGSKRARPAIKSLNHHWLVALGAVGYEQLKKFRSRCANRLKKKRKAYKEKYPTEFNAKDARNKVQQDQLFNGIKANKVINKRSKVLADCDKSKELRRQFNLEQSKLTSELHQAGKSPLDIRAEIKRLYGDYDAWLKNKH